jgi:hypothetical protein
LYNLVLILLYKVIKTNMLQQSEQLSPDGEALPPPRPEGLEPPLSQLALSGVGISAAHFYGGKDSSIGIAPSSDKATGVEYRLLIPGLGDGAQNEAVGVGGNTETALRDSLRKMRALETVKTKSLAHIEMSEKTSVAFTALEHYNPKVAPSRETYKVPSYLEGLLTDDKEGKMTYTNTLEREGWQTELQTMLAEYITQDETGIRLAASLNIHSLTHLTPEQAVKLSTAFVQDVSKYSYDEARSKGLTRSDKSNAPELLREGMREKNNPHRPGNGVCRNIASNVKAVFEALKQTQAELSMLNNTYAVYGGGFNGSGYADSREDPFRTSITSTGHAWDTFVTIDSEGSAVATIVDATWALESRSGAAMEAFDYTQMRAAGQIMKLFKKSEAKEEAFYGVTDYFLRLVRQSYIDQRTDAPSRQALREYATTSYLRAAALLPTIPEDIYLPDALMSGAYRLRGKLDRQEVATIFALHKATDTLDTPRMEHLISQYDGNRDVPLDPQTTAENLVFADDELQALAYHAVGEERVRTHAEGSGKFRARLRELQPELLPQFNALENPADARELSYLAELSGVSAKDPKIIMKLLHSKLKTVTGDDSLYDAIVVGRSDYELAKNFGKITAALRRRNTSATSK